MQFYIESLLSEGKHWPEDYKKTAINTIKNSELGKQSWYSDQYIKQDVDTFAQEFRPLSHVNSNLGYFMSIIRMFIEYAKTNKQKYQEFIEIKLDNIIRWLLLLTHDKALEAREKDKIKAGISYEEFEQLIKPIENKQVSLAKNTKFEIKDKGYLIDIIYTYEQLNEKFGGDVTGCNGESKWCHTNGKSTYESWTEHGTKNFFVIYKKDFRKINHPDQSTSAYDDYGLSMMAILVDVKSGSLKNCTLRYNHAVDPSQTISGRTTDNAFIDFNEISKVVGFDVKKKVAKMMANSKAEIKKIESNTNSELKKLLANKTSIDKSTIPATLKNFIIKVEIPNSITSIGDYAFYGCSGLTRVEIPGSVTSIGAGAFKQCTKLKIVILKSSKTKYQNDTFPSNCKIIIQDK